MIDDETLEILQEAARWATSRHCGRYGFLWHVDRDDLYASALLAAIEALPRWDRERGASLHSFLRIRLDGELMDVMRKLQGRGDAVHNIFPTDPCEMPDAIYDDSAAHAAIEEDLMLAGLEDALLRSGVRRRNVDMILSVIRGESRTSVAARHGLSISAVTHILRRKQSFIVDFLEMAA